MFTCSLRRKLDTSFVNSGMLWRVLHTHTYTHTQFSHFSATHWRLPSCLSVCGKRPLYLQACVSSVSLQVPAHVYAESIALYLLLSWDQQQSNLCSTTSMAEIIRRILRLLARRTLYTSISLYTLQPHLPDRSLCSSQLLTPPLTFQLHLIWLCSLPFVNFIIIFNHNCFLLRSC